MAVRRARLAAIARRIEVGRGNVDGQVARLPREGVAICQMTVLSISSVGRAPVRGRHTQTVTP